MKRIFALLLLITLLAAGCSQLSPSGEIKSPEATKEAELTNLQKAFDRAEAGNVNGAIEFFNLALKDTKVPRELSDIHVNLSKFYEMAQKSDEARTAVQEAVKADPTNNKAWLTKANFHLNHNEIDMAISVLQEGLQKLPEAADLLTNLGTAYIVKGDFDQAIASLEKASALVPESGMVYAYEAYAYAKKGDFTKADALIELARKNGYVGVEQMKVQIDALRK